jgi:hypothetical protein
MDYERASAGTPAAAVETTAISGTVRYFLGMKMKAAAARMQTKAATWFHLREALR